MNSPLSTSHRNMSFILGQASCSNKSMINNSSNTSTMITGTESLIMNSIRINNKTRSFQIRNKKLKNEIKSLKKINIENYSYRKLILQKSLMNIANGTISGDFNYKKKLFFKGYYNILKKEASKCDPNSSLTNKIIDQIYENKIKSKLSYSARMEKIILLKKYIFDQKLNYKNKLLENEIDDNLIIKYNSKIQRINFIIKELDNILTLHSYAKFLKEKKNQLKIENMEQFTQIDILRNDINELLIKIRAKADKLADLINIRNLLVCIKECILMKDLPLNFTFYPDNYNNILDNVIKNINNNNYFKSTNDGSKNFEIPRNLMESIYSKLVNKMDLIKTNKHYNTYKNYLKISYPIFENKQDFQIYFKDLQKTIKDRFINILNQNYRQYDVNTDINLIDGKNGNLTELEEIIGKKKIYLDEIKERNNFLNIYYKKILKENVSLKDYEKDGEKSSLRNLNKLLIESNFKHISGQSIKFLYNFNRLREEKKYKIKGAYIYHTLMKIILSMYKICPKYIKNQHNFQLDIFELRIKNFRNIIKESKFNILAYEIKYLFSIYESAIFYLFADYNRHKDDINRRTIFNSIRDKIFNNRRKELFRFRFDLEGKLNDAKIEKIFLKQNKYILRKHNFYFPVIHHVKLKKNKSQEKLIDKNSTNSLSSINNDYSTLNI